MKQAAWSVAATVAAAAIFWLSQNLVLAGDLKQVEQRVVNVEREVLKSARRDLSREIRALERVDNPSVDDVEALAEAESDLMDVQEALDRLDDD